MTRDQFIKRLGEINDYLADYKWSPYSTSSNLTEDALQLNCNLHYHFIIASPDRINYIYGYYGPTNWSAYKYKHLEDIRVYFEPTEKNGYNLKIDFILKKKNMRFSHTLPY